MKRKYLPRFVAVGNGCGKVFPILFLILWTASLKASTYFVSPAGNDSRTNAQATNRSTPWKTIRKAASILAAGDSLIVLPGTYVESDIPFSNSGAPGKWITVTGEPGTRPDVTGTGQYGFIIQGQLGSPFTKTHFHIRNLSFHGYQQDGVSVYYADFVFLDDLIVYDNGNAGLNTVGSNHIIIQDCVLHHNGWKADGDSGWGDGASINNRELLDSGIQWFSIVRRNVMYANWQKRNGSYWDGNGFTWDLAGTGGLHLMTRNIFYNNGGSGVLNNNTGNLAMIHNILFRNMADTNRCQNMAELYLTDQWVHNAVLKNNIIYGRKRTARYDQICPIILEDADNQTGIKAENNWVWGELGNATEIYWLGFMSLAEWKRRFAPTTLTGDPGFVSAPLDWQKTLFHGLEWIDMDAARYNFKLKKESGCIDQGTVLTRIGSAGSGTVVPLESARCLTDGFGIPGQGDIIQIGAEKNLRILSADYTNNRITVDRNISWKAGDGVSYPYTGQNPDIGIHEYEPLYFPQIDPDPIPITEKELYATIQSFRVLKKVLSVELTASETVVKNPGPLYMDEADGTVSTIVLTGAVPGNVFTGALALDGSVAEGTARYRLPSDALMDAGSTVSDEIRSGDYVELELTPPAAPGGMTVAALSVH
ncbi:right-handed parallel beta-helix repeat-containing protein [bacterium]|nr:right-handed parallel beta-helix repeat-containing protein [bacterium]